MSLPPTLTAQLWHWAETTPDAVALRHKGKGLWREFTWRDFLLQVATTARALHHTGIKRGDFVSILADNRPEWLYVDLATQTLGGRSVGIYQTNPADEVRFIVNHSDSRLLFCEDQEQVDKAIDIRDEVKLSAVVAFDNRGLRHYDSDFIIEWDTFLKRGQDLEPEALLSWFRDLTASMDPEEPSMVIYTSGTTGEPKGALISNANVMQLAQMSTAEFKVTPADSVLSYLPLCHIAEKIFTLFIPLTSGAVTHFGESIETVQSDLAEVSPTVFLGVPRIWERMHSRINLKMKDASWLKRSLYLWALTVGEKLREAKASGGASIVLRLQAWLSDLAIYRPLQERLGLRRVRFAVSGAAPISPDLIGWFHSIGIQIAEGYGQTESTGVSHCNRPENIRIGTVGQIMPGMECRIADDGEILLRGPAVFCGYLHNDAATKDTIDPEGWLHTGDIGTEDTDGFLSITGRKKEIIITSGGKNLSPERLENTLKLSEFIKEAVTLGDGQKYVAALIQIEYETTSDWAQRRKLPHTSYADLVEKPEVRDLIEAEITRLNEHLARVEQIKAFRFFPKELHQDDGELTPTQKVKRKAVREIYASLIDSIYKGGSRG